MPSNAVVLRSAHAPTRFGKAYGPWAVVTGASDGIGRAFAERLAEARLNVVLVARRKEVLDELASDLERRFAIETRVVAADLSERNGIATLEKSVADLTVGLLVAAAGFGTSGDFIEQSIDAELEMIDVNCSAVAALAHHFGNRFAKQRRGGLVLLSSLLAFQGVPRAANYAATKAYVQSLAEGLRAELAPLGVDVVASAPGPIHSGFAARARMNMGVGLSPKAVASATLDALGKQGTVRPGWLSKFLEASLATLPRVLRVRAMGAVMRGMTKHQGAASSPHTLEEGSR